MTPDVRVVRGEPDDVELAALVAGLATGSLTGAPDPSRGVPGRRDAAARQRWRDGAQPIRDPLHPSKDAWRWSTQIPR